MYELFNIFDVFLPQLLLYPNPADPLNSDAARLMNKDLAEYEAKVREHVKMYATKEEVKVDNPESDLEGSVLSEASDEKSD